MMPIIVRIVSNPVDGTDPAVLWESEHATRRAAASMRRAHRGAHPWRRWQVVYSRHCMYWPMDGWAPYIAGATYHWTRRGADWSRRHGRAGRKEGLRWQPWSGWLVTSVSER